MSTLLPIIVIEKLARTEHGGDWHDRGLKWIAKGPFNESQKFSTKKEAQRWRNIRRNAYSFEEALHAYLIHG